MAMMNRRSAGDREVFEVRFGLNRQLCHYKLVVRADGSFAAKCLETDRYVAGYDASNPDLLCEEAARRVYDVRHGEFYTLFLRCTRAHLDEQIRKEYERVKKMLPSHNELSAAFPGSAMCDSLV